jgi:hypothetical protein
MKTITLTRGMPSLPLGTRKQDLIGILGRIPKFDPSIKKAILAKKLNKAKGSLALGRNRFASI